MEKLKVLELFGGTGTQTQALKNIGIEHTSTLCEIDKYASDVYNQLHGETKNLGDITKVDINSLKEGDYDLITYSSPCQDFSICGLNKGGDKGSGTRSSLLFECEKIIRKVKPKYLLFENVKNLLSDQHRHNFMEWLKILRDMGYKNYYDVLNAKDYGIPQNRERVFCVSILGEDNYFEFPQKQELKLRLKDMLEDKPDEKYYLSNDKINKISMWKSQQQPLERVLGENSISPTLTARGAGEEHSGMILYSGELKETTNIQKECLETKKDPKIDRIGGLYGQATRWGVYNKEGISPTIVASMGEGGGHVPMIETDEKVERLTKQAYETLEENNCKDGDIINPFNKKVTTDGICPTITTRPEGFKTANLVVVDDRQGTLFDMEECVQKAKTDVKIDESCYNKVAQNFEREKDAIANSDKEIYYPECESGFQDNRVGLKISPAVRAANDNLFALDNHFRIRKLTVRECWRLMGWKDEQFDKIKGISNAQLYKMAGNAIVINVLEAIFRQMFLVKYDKKDISISGEQLDLF